MIPYSRHNPNSVRCSIKHGEDYMSRLPTLRLSLQTKSVCSPLGWFQHDSCFIVSEWPSGEFVLLHLFLFRVPGGSSAQSRNISFSVFHFFLSTMITRRLARFDTQSRKMRWDLEVLLYSDSVFPLILRGHFRFDINPTCSDCLTDSLE